MIPVAEPTFVGVQAAPAAVAAAPAVAAIPAAVTPVIATAQAAEPVIPVRIAIVGDQTQANAAAAQAAADCEKVTICKEEYQALLVKAGANPAAAPQPTPAATTEASKQEIDNLRSQVQQYQDEIDTLIRDIKAQSGQN